MSGNKDVPRAAAGTALLIIRTAAALLAFGPTLPAQPLITAITAAANVRHLGSEQARENACIRSGCSHLCQRTKQANSSFRTVQRASSSSSGIPPLTFSLRNGHLVKVDGVTAAGDFSSSITKARITVIGRAGMPKPLRLPLIGLSRENRTASGDMLTGVVRSGREENESSTSTLSRPAGHFSLS